MVIKINKWVPDFRVAGSIFNTDEIKVGTFFTNVKNLETSYGNLSLELSLVNHNLSKGTYYFSFSVGKGDEEYGNIEFDIVYDVLTFEITHKNNITDPINKWPRDWGNISFQADLKLLDE
jgi:lipopolysaccharide transport system ATP-binding protein